MNNEIENKYHETQVNKAITICLENGNQIRKKNKSW